MDGAEHCRGDRAEDGAGSRKDDDGTEGTGGDLEPAGNWRRRAPRRRAAGSGATSYAGGWPARVHVPGGGSCVPLAAEDEGRRRARWGGSGGGGGLPRLGRLPVTRGRFPWLRRREEAVKGAAAGGEGGRAGEGGGRAGGRFSLFFTTGQISYRSTVAYCVVGSVKHRMIKGH